MRQFTHVDCFSGPGGICTGFHAAGLNTLVAIEYIRSCVDTYSSNHPDVHVIHSDIRDVQAEQVLPYIPAEGVDIVTSGMPCETFSTAGNTSRSFYDDRQFLFREGIRIAEICNVTDIWNAIYRAHLLRKVNITSINDIDETVVDAIISGSQSWKKSSGHVFEDYVCRTTKERLSQYNIRFVLQKDLTQMLQDGQIANDPSDDIEAIARSDNFDIYAIVNVNGNNIVFGCVQAKTSIRDRVGRDREFSARIMEKNFWSVAVVLDGTYLAMPKFEAMVNGGGVTQYTDNGWHGMYSMSNADERDRIYSDKHLSLLISDAKQAAEKFTSARQRFTKSWQALHE